MKQGKRVDFHVLVISVSSVFFFFTGGFFTSAVRQLSIAKAAVLAGSAQVLICYNICSLLLPSAVRIVVAEKRTFHGSSVEEIERTPLGEEAPIDSSILCPRYS